MGFLKRIFRSGSTEVENHRPAGISFEALSEEELQTHLAISRYGYFELTDAVRPSYDLQIVPRQGFRRDRYTDETGGIVLPVVMAAVTRPTLMEVFLDLLDPLGPVVDVVLESSHHGNGGSHDHYRDQIDIPVLKSILLDFEDLLLNDGCTGVAVVAPSRGQEVQLDEHKMIIAYGEPLEPFENRLITADVYPDPSIRFVTEAEHVHSSNRKFVGQFERLRSRLGMDSGQPDDPSAW